MIDHLANEDPQQNDLQGNQTNEQPEIKPETPEHERRISEGRQGKLFCVEVTYHAGDHREELKRKVFKNMFWHEVLDFRNDLPVVGMMYRESPGRYRLVLPQNIHEVYIDRQNGYFSVF